MGTVVSHRPSYAEMIRWAEVNWKAYTPIVTKLRPGVFIFRFSNEADRIDVLGKQRAFYHKYQMVVKGWSVEKGVEQEVADSTPVWIQLPGLIPRLWSTKNLTKIASYVGEPLATDHMTAVGARLDYARVLVEVSTKKQLPETIPINGPGGITFDQKIIYEWNTKRCDKCKLVGHLAEQCRYGKSQARKDMQKNDGQGVVNPQNAQLAQSPPVAVAQDAQTQPVIQNREKGQIAPHATVQNTVTDKRQVTEKKKKNTGNNQNQNTKQKSNEVLNAKEVIESSNNRNVKAEHSNTKKKQDRGAAKQRRAGIVLKPNG